MRHGDIGQSHRHCLGRRVAAAQIPDLARLLLADQARKISGAEARIDRADPRPGLAELGPVRRDGEVADRISPAPVSTMTPMSRFQPARWKASISSSTVRPRKAL
jgi:hypothetical protein